MSYTDRFAITIYNNAAAHKKTIEEVCETNGVKIGPLFEAIIENFAADDWKKYSDLAKIKKGIGKDLRNKVSKSITKLDEKGLDAVLAALREQGITLDSAE